MNVQQLESSLGEATPPSGLPPLVQALWHERHGDWTRAHEITQDIDGADAAWVHAYLHRREGDLPNAGYWYRLASKPVTRMNLNDEWRAIAEALLSSGDRS